MRRIIQAIFCLMASCAFADPSAELTAYGVFENQGRVEEFVDSPGITNGFKVLSGPYKLIKKTDRVKAQMWTIFGIQYSISGLPEKKQFEEKVVFQHPPILDKNGNLQTTSVDVDILYTADGTYDSEFYYRLSRAEELVPGKWSFRVYCNDKLVTSKEFYVSE